MLYKGKILNDAGAPVPGALLTFKADTGAVVARIPVTGGAWSLDSSFDDGLLTPGMVAVFSAPGYQDFFISAVTIPQNFDVTLIKKPQVLPLILSGAALAALLLYNNSTPRRRRVSGAGPGNSSKGVPGWLLPAGLLAGGAYVLYQFFGKADPRLQQGAGLAAAADRELLAEIAAGRVATLTSTQAEALAASIVQAANDCGTDENAIYSAFEELSNKADLLLLIKTYNVRVYHACFDGDWFKDTPRNLAETLTAELNSSGRGTINNILQNKGINFAF